MSGPKPTDAAIAVTYDCDSRCVMCNIWKSPGTEHMSPEVLGRLPRSLRTVNLTGGEPFLRDDLPEIVHSVKSACPTSKIIISTNGLRPQRIGLMMREILRHDPKIGVGISIDGAGKMHDGMRGVKGAFDRAMETLDLVRSEGVRNLRFAYTATSRNLTHLEQVFRLSREKGIEFTLAVAQNSEHYFQTSENMGIEDMSKLRGQFNYLISMQLAGWHPKRWARAYFARGLYEFAANRKRALQCGAGSDFFFLDPRGDVYGCNVLPNVIGNLAREDFATLWTGPRAEAARDRVARCQEGCWMICTARTAMQRHPFSVGSWMLRSKALHLLGKKNFLR